MAGQGVDHSFGARLVVLDAPAGMTFGIDAMSYTTGPKFKGVRGIPPGIHYCHYSVGGGDEEQSSGFGGRHGFFFSCHAPDDVACWVWDAGREDLVPAGSKRSPLPSGSHTTLLAAAARGALDGNLGPYPLETIGLWCELSSCLSEFALERCGVPLGVKVLPGDPEAALDSDDDDDDDDHDDHDEGWVSGKVVPFFDEDGVVARFPAADVPLPKLRHARLAGGEAGSAVAASAGGGAGGTGGTGDSGACGGGEEERGAGRPPLTDRGRALARMSNAERTAWYADGSRRVLALVHGELSSGPGSGGLGASGGVESGLGGESSGWKGLLGEVQVDFLIFSLGFSLPALRHWKRRLALLGACGPDAVSALPELFAALCHTIVGQLELVGGVKWVDVLWCRLGSLSHFFHYF